MDINFAHIHLNVWQLLVELLTLTIIVPVYKWLTEAGAQRFSFLAPLSTLANAI